MARQIYCTSFCNFGHDLDTGRPIGHECYVIWPSLLKAEIERDDGMWPEQLREAWAKVRRIVKGRKI